jgi:hypothetical protein
VVPGRDVAGRRQAAVDSAIAKCASLGLFSSLKIGKKRYRPYMGWLDPMACPALKNLVLKTGPAFAESHTDRDL